MIFSMSQSGHSSLFFKTFLGLIVNSVLLYILQRYFPQYLSIQGGLKAVAIAAVFITLLNIFLRPVLAVITFPARMIATLLTLILVNLFFLWIVTKIIAKLDPTLVTFAVVGGFTGWFVVSSVIGFANWIIKRV